MALSACSEAKPNASWTAAKAHRGHNTFELGENVPMSTANLNDGLVALKDGKMVLLRVPYPLGFYAKGFDGRIDDPNAGWKGRGLWTTSGDRAPWLMEGGKGKKPESTRALIEAIGADDIGAQRTALRPVSLSAPLDTPFATLWRLHVATRWVHAVCSHDGMRP